MKWRKLSLALIGSTAMLASIVGVSEAQDSDGDVPGDPAHAQPLSAAVFHDVIPGLETQGDGNTYVLLDSTDVGGPTFDTPSYDPTTLAPLVSDAGDEFELVTIGFAFEFYGDAHASVGVSDNGYLAFDVANGSNADDPAADPDLLTSVNPTEAVIMPFFYDLFPGDPIGGGGEIYYDTFGVPGSRVFVVEYRGVVPNGGYSSGGTFQVRLFEGSNAIEYHYYDVEFGSTGDFGGQATIGLRRAGGAGFPYVQYSSNSPQIENGLAIRFWQPTCGGQTPNVVGDRGDDNLSGAGMIGGGVVYGHTGDDTIQGGDLNDLLCGGPGNYTISGGFGNDRIFGQGDDDEIFGQQGRDTIDGGVGNDRIFGQGADDVIQGGGGADVLRGGVGNDRLVGGVGPDLIFGNNGVDEAFGGPDNDIIRGQANPDILRGQGGNDLIIGGGGNDVHDGGPGVDNCVEGANQGLPETYVSCETQP